MAMLMFINEAAKHFGIDKNILFDMKKRGDLPMVKVGKTEKLNSILFTEQVNEMTRKGEVIR